MTITRLQIPAFDPAEFLRKLGAKEKHPVLVQSGRWTIVAWNPSAFLRFHSVSDARESLYALASKRRKTYDGPLPFVGGIIGYVSADAGYELLGIEATAADPHTLPVVCAGIYDDVILFDGEYVIAVGSKRFASDVSRIAARKIPKPSVPALRFRPSVSFQEYTARFRHVQKLIRDGIVYQLNLTHTFEAHSTADPRALFAALTQAHPAGSAAYLDSGDHRLLSLSPERFLEIHGSCVATFPVKGTRPRGKTVSEDMRLKKELLESPKEAAELNMITDLLRNDIGKVARTGSVRVSEHRRIDATPSVWHTSSVIEAELEKKYSPLDAFFSMLPAGSVTGCPKKQACIEIDRLESIKRGPYTGAIFTWSDHGDLGSSIIIRTLVHSGQKYSLGVGGGIVADSDVRKEWAETEQKAAPFLNLKSRRAKQSKKR